MKTKNYLFPVLLGLSLCVFLSPILTLAAMDNSQSAETVIIPPQVKKVLEEGMPTRQVSTDIPFNIIKHIYLPDFPARQTIHSIFLFKIKNSDLGYADITLAGGKEKKQKKEEVSSIFDASPNLLQSNSNVFLQFNRMENGTVGELATEFFIRVRLQTDSTAYEPDEVDLYSTACVLPPGDYLLSMAITSADLKKIGTQYFEFSLPDEASFSDKIESSPIFLLKEWKQLNTPIRSASVVKEYFLYLVYQFACNIDNTISIGSNLELFYYIYGAKPGEDGKYNILIDYEILKGEEATIRWETVTYNNPLIQQSLPLVKTVITSTESGEKQEQKNLESGNYIFSIKVSDKITGNTLEKKIDFRVK